MVEVPEVHVSIVKALHHIADFKLMRENQQQMLLYIFATLTYLGINLALFGLNFRDQDFIEEFYYLPFHLLEFWAVFVFTLIEGFVLVSTGTLQVNGPLGQRLQIGLAGFDILFTLIIAIIFTMYPEEYEVPTHWMEYSAQLFITLVNFVFVLNFSRMKQYQSGLVYKFRHVQTAVASLAFILSVLQFFVYSGIIPTPPGPERTAHFFEFITESLNAVVVLWFSVLAYLQMDRLLASHYTGMHEMVNVMV